MLTSCAAAALLALAAAPSAAPVTHPFGWEDMFGMLRLGDPQPSPDGARVLFTRTSYDVEENRANADLAWVEIGSGRVRRLTTAAGPDLNGRWSADGRSILFLSARSGSMQLWRLPADGGEAEQLTRLPLDLEGFEPSPDGGRVLFWTFVFPDCKDLECTAKRLEERAASKVQARVFERTFVRHWDTWMDGRRQHLFVLPLAGGAPVDLTQGWDQDAPTRPFGGADELDWSPDGKRVAFASKPSKDEPWTTNVELYLAPADGKAPPRLLTADNPAWDTHPRFSPDGGRLAYLAMARPGFEADRLTIQVLDLAGGKRTAVAPGWDRSPTQLVWAADGKTLYAAAEEHARGKIFSVELAGGRVRPLVEEGTNGSLALSRLGALV
ncbi:MAG TPA: S9 family peptidase, partial [Myxococcota bacterium]|nr:S9 family peptidase [Myxococcota bacterium]